MGRTGRFGHDLRELLDLIGSPFEGRGGGGGGGGRGALGGPDVLNGAGTAASTAHYGTRFLPSLAPRPTSTYISTSPLCSTGVFGVCHLLVGF
jgi:hypothetical protein